MDNSKPRVERNEIEILHQKVDRLAGQLKQRKSEKTLLHKIKDVVSILSPLLVATIDFYATFSISGAIQQEKLKLDHLTAMQRLMDNFVTPYSV